MVAECRYHPFLSVKEGKKCSGCKNDIFFAFLKSFSVPLRKSFVHNGFLKPTLYLLFERMDIEIHVIPLSHFATMYRIWSRPCMAYILSSLATHRAEA